MLLSHNEITKAALISLETSENKKRKIKKFKNKILQFRDFKRRPDRHLFCFRSYRISK